jgi:hypothetical protein
MESNIVVTFVVTPFLTEWWVVEKKKATATNFEELLP